MLTPASTVYTASQLSQAGAFKFNHHHVHACSTGERFPVYRDGCGMIDEQLCTYMAAIRRSSVSVNTRLQKLRGATALLGYTSQLGLDLADRIACGAFLDPGEQFGFDEYLTRTTNANAETRLLRHRGGLAFVRFKWRRQAALLADYPDERARYVGLANEFAEEFAEVFPYGDVDRSLPTGLDENGLTALVRFLTDPAQIAGLWPDPFIAARNTLLFLCFVLLGHRAGEFLCLRLADINLDTRLYRVRRLHNSPADPRIEQPLTKGRERELKWPPELLGVTWRYIAERAKRPVAGKHDFFLVASDGSPMSRSLVWKIFSSLHEHLPTLGERFGPHRLRHTWNDLFSEAATRMGITSEQEIRARMLAMGWVSRDMAKTYTRRSDAKAVDDVSMLMQQMIFQDGGRL